MGGILPGSDVLIAHRLPAAPMIGQLFYDDTVYFVEQYIPFCRIIADKSGIPPSALVHWAAIRSIWGANRDGP
ncbi:hypothetical protein [Paracoccus sediminilitoris]|uniref:hypothetical protein n=1 Tax=Paracoccus sediminilitoris TaxID=2202419 RepID=UPI00272BBF64|nr:hypothetical protein [Paracoccus sediminilitoris]